MSVRAAAKRYGVNPKTILKWRRRTDVSDAPIVHKERSYVLSTEDESLIVAFRMLTRLPLDDCLHALKGTLPHLTRSSLHRCFQYYEVDKLLRGRAVTRGTIGYFALDIDRTETRSRVYQYFAATDLVSRVFLGQLKRNCSESTAAEFLKDLIANVPYRIHTIATPTLPPFANLSARGPRTQLQEICEAYRIRHVRIAPQRTWGAQELRNPDSAIALLQRRGCRYDSPSQVRELTNRFVSDFNFKRRLKCLAGRTSYEFVQDAYKAAPDLFHAEPAHLKAWLQTL